MPGCGGGPGPFKPPGSHALCGLFPWGKRGPPAFPFYVLSLVAGGEDYTHCAIGNPEEWVFLWANPKQGEEG